LLKRATPEPNSPRPSRFLLPPAPLGNQGSGSSILSPRASVLELTRQHPRRHSGIGTGRSASDEAAQSRAVAPAQSPA